MEDAFTRIVEQIFSNWSALQLAVEHAMGGVNSKQTAVETIKYMVNYCVTEPVDPEDIEDVLEDIMDQEFNTICEDNSIKEVSAIMYGFLQLLKAGNTEQCELEYAKLPPRKDWIVNNEPAYVEIRPSRSNIPESSPSGATMESEDSEWTEVKIRRKK